jgi:hypothetical protein
LARFTNRRKVDCACSAKAISRRRSTPAIGEGAHGRTAQPSPLAAAMAPLALKKNPNGRGPNPFKWLDFQ